jgi:hypothetical protein
MRDDVSIMRSNMSKDSVGLGGTLGGHDWGADYNPSQFDTHYASTFISKPMDGRPPRTAMHKVRNRALTYRTPLHVV